MNYRRVALIFTLTIMVIMLALPFVVRADEPATAPAAAAAPAVADAPDPAGATTGTVKDITAKEAGKPVLAEIADAVGHNKISINIMWTLITGFLVMFMQAGFAMVETGFCPGQERGPHHAHEYDGLRRRHVGLLDLRFCPDVRGCRAGGGPGHGRQFGQRSGAPSIRQRLRHPGLQRLLSGRSRGL